MRHLIESTLTALTGNAPMQRLLEFNVLASQYLMGIGVSGSVYSSGEKILFRLLKQRHSTHGSSEPVCIFDVGANQGDFVKLVQSELQGMRTVVHAFEPARQTFDLLVKSAGGGPNVSLNHFGLGRSEGSFELFYDKAGSGLASLSKRDLAHCNVAFDASETVQIKTLDAYCDSRQIKEIDLLKLDVEGHELDVLNGGLRLFKSRGVKMVSFEFGGCNIDSRTYFRDLWHFFGQNWSGTINRITPSGHLVPIKRYRELYEQFRITNFLAIHD